MFERHVRKYTWCNREQVMFCMGVYLLTDFVQRESSVALEASFPLMPGHAVHRMLVCRVAISFHYSDSSIIHLNVHIIIVTCHSYIQVSICHAMAPRDIKSS